MVRATHHPSRSPPHKPSQATEHTIASRYPSDDKNALPSENIEMKTYTAADVKCSMIQNLQKLNTWRTYSVPHV